MSSFEKPNIEEKNFEKDIIEKQNKKENIGSEEEQYNDELDEIVTAMDKRFFELKDQGLEHREAMKQAMEEYKPKLINLDRKFGKLPPEEKE
ncbi:MAG: hypothetical protein PHI88_02915 [Candidatus Pacebacteria bacterium]|nr:hypothetical protein [Candidatus Paceibacterota bacterium]